jgi:hypothetical protein
MLLFVGVVLYGVMANLGKTLLAMKSQGYWSTVMPMPRKRPSAVPGEWSLKRKRYLASEVRSAVAPQIISVNRTLSKHDAENA